MERSLCSQRLLTPNRTTRLSRGKERPRVTRVDGEKLADGSDICGTKITGVGILKIFDDLHEQGKTIILVTHDESVSRHAQRAIRLRDGQVESDVRQ